MTDSPSSETHASPLINGDGGSCLFRSGSSWFAVPVTSIREVTERPDIVFVPGTPASFSGLCHIRSEFIPVLNLKSILSQRELTEEQAMLVMEDSDGPWALLIDEVSSLQQLEISDAPDAEDSGAEAIVTGWATFGETVVQALDPGRIRRRAEREITGRWQRPDPLAQDTSSV